MTTRTFFPDESIISISTRSCFRASGKVDNHCSPDPAPSSPRSAQTFEMDADRSRKTIKTCNNHML